MSVSFYSIPIINLMEEIKDRKNYTMRKEAMHYCSPSGGGFGVVQVACIVPETEVLFAIPIGCGRHGSIASFGNETAEKLSFFIIEETDIIMGSHLKKIEDAAKEIFEERNPKAIILCSTCMDDLLGSDYESILMNLEKELNIPVRRGKMNPILSDTPKDPSLMIQKTIYEFLENIEKAQGQINVIGSFANLDQNSEIHQLLEKAQLKPLRHISDYRSFDKYKYEMSRSYANLLVSMGGIVAAKDLEKRLNQPYLEVYTCFRLEEIERNYRVIEEFVNKKLDRDYYKKLYSIKLEKTRQSVEGLRVALGANAMPRPFECARFLVELGMKVDYIITKAVPEIEKEHVKWLQINSSDTVVIPNLEPSIGLLQEKIARVDICFGLDAAMVFDRTFILELPNTINLFGYQAGTYLMDILLERKAFEGNIIDLVYKANLVI